MRKKGKVKVTYNRPLRNYLELLREFFINDFKLRYKKSVLGVLWAIIRPLAQFYVLYNIWLYFGKATPGFAYFVLAGIMVYNMFSETLLYSMTSLFNKGHIILKIYFPREVVVLAAALVAQINFFFNMLVFFVLLLMSGFKITEALDMLLHVVIAGGVAFLGGLAIGMFLSIWYVKFRDLNHLLDLVLYILFWLIPIMYPLEMIKDSSLYPVVLRNPLTWVILFFKDAFAGGGYHWSLLLKALGVFAVLLVMAIINFRRNIRNVAEYY